MGTGEWVSILYLYEAVVTDSPQHTGSCELCVKYLRNIQKTSCEKERERYCDNGETSESGDSVVVVRLVM